MAKLPAPAGLYVGTETGADRSLFLRWVWKQKNTDHFEVRWEYRTGNTVTDVIKDKKTKKKKKVTSAVWFTGSETSASADIRIATYNFPANAKEVRVKIQAIAKENSDNKPIWTSDPSKWVYFTPKDIYIKADKIKSKPTSLAITKERDASNVLHARWKWSYKFTELFRVKWLYTDGTPITVDKKTKALWYIGAVEEVAYNPTETQYDYYTSIYNYPESAKRVVVRVEPISKIKYETETVIAYYWNADYEQKEYAITPYSPPSAGVKVSNIAINYQNGTSRGIIVSWQFNKGYVDHYEYRWQYTTGQQKDVIDPKTKKSKKETIYLDSDSGSTTNLHLTYTLPDEAVRARVVITPIAKNNSAGFAVWKADSSGWVYSPRAAKQLSTTVSNFTIVQEQGSESTYVARWNWSYGYTDHYDVSWFYTTGTLDASKKNAIRYSGTTESTKNLYSTYSPPSNANSIICVVLPVAQASRWVGKQAEVTYKITDNLASPLTNKKAVTNLSIYQQDGSPKTLVATWSWDTKGFSSTIENYEVDWRYNLQLSNGSTVWMVESLRTTVSAEATTDIYNAPEKAVQVNVRVRPVSKKHKVQGIDTAYWTADWSERVSFDIVSAEAAADPPVPQTPSVLMEGLDLIASVNIYDEGVDTIEFNIVKDDSSEFGTVPAKISYNHAEVRVSVPVGGEYKVRARSLRTVSDSGDSLASAVRGDWSEYSENVSTIPASPEQILSHVIESSTSVYLQWSQVLNVTGYKIEYATNPDYFDESGDVKSISTGPASAYHITGLETGHNYYFRVRAVNNNGESGWTPIYSLILGTRPDSPTTWSDTTRGVIGEELYLYWTHNSEDKSSQRAAQLELTINNVDVIVIDIDPADLTDGSTPSFYIFDTLMQIEHDLIDDSENEIVDQDSETISAVSIAPYSERTSVLWRVRTKGIVDEWSDWSTQRTILLYSEPTISLYVGTDKEFNDRVNEIRHYPLYVHAEAFPKIQKAIGYTITITATESYETVDRVGDIVSIRDQQSIFEKYYPATDENVLDVSLSANDVNLSNDITYILNVTVAMDSGLTGTSGWTFAARWDDVDLTPDAEVTINRDSLCAYIRPYCLTENGDYILNVLLSVYRIEYDGRFVLIAENVANGETTVVDPHPALNYARYRVIATSLDTGEMGFADIPGAFVGETAIVLQWDEAWRSFETYDGEADGEFATPVYSGSTLKLPYNVEISDNNDIDVALNEYIGRSHPVSYYGTQLGVKGSWSAVIPRDDMETLYALRRLAIYRGDVYVREPSGVGYWANISVSFSKRYSEMTIPVSLNVTRVEGGI